MIDYRRDLPHWFPDGPPIFLTWRLAGSLPAAAKLRLQQAQKLSAAESFRMVDADLDKGGTGPLWLKRPEVADGVEQAFHVGQLRGQFELHAYVVMANHIHVLLTPKRQVRSITNLLKGITARQANSILGRTGRAFWQDESFDHWIRNEAQFARTKHYIENNPVKAGLVAKAEDWRWSSAKTKFCGAANRGCSAAKKL